MFRKQTHCLQLRFSLHDVRDYIKSGITWCPEYEKLCIFSDKIKTANEDDYVVA